MSAVYYSTYDAEPTAPQNHLVGLSKDLSQMLQMKNSLWMTARLGNDSTAPTSSLEHDLFSTLILSHELRPHITDFGWRLFNILAAIVNKTQHTHIEIAKCRYSVSNGTQTTRHLRPRGEDCIVDCLLGYLYETQNQIASHCHIHCYTNSRTVTGTPMSCQKPKTSLFLFLFLSWRQPQGCQGPLYNVLRSLQTIVHSFDRRHASWYPLFATGTFREML